MSDDLPQEVVTEILLRLSLKSLLKCRCVSKTWDFLIKSPSFASQHLKRTSTDFLFFRYKEEDNVSIARDEKERFFLYPDDGFPDYPLQEFDCPFKASNSFFIVVGCCNGVICLCDDDVCYTGRAAMWNPSIRKIVYVPRPNVNFMSYGPYLLSLGFGFDSKTDDYKLVRLAYLEGANFFEAPPLVEVFSLRSKRWRMVDNDLKHIIRPRSASVVVNGACHWVAGGGIRDNVVVSFDLADEVFGEVTLPDCLSKKCFRDVRVAEYDGSLVFVTFNEDTANHTLSVWVMKEYGIATSWTELYNITGLEKMPTIVAFRKNGMVLLGIGERLAFCDMKLQNIHHKFQGVGCSFYLNTYVESLILLSEANEFVMDEAFDCGVSQVSKDHSSSIDSSNDNELG